MEFSIVGANHPSRERVESMVRSVYAAAYGACIRGFPPLMAAALDGDNPLCAAGLRTATTGFFSECYLDAPVQHCIGAAVGEPVRRDAVLEVTTLAAVVPRLARGLLDFIAEESRMRGIRWGMFTGTAALRRALALAGFRLIDLGVAAPSRIDDVACWGSYYSYDPRVCALANPRYPLAARTLPALGRDGAAARPESAVA